MYVPAPFAEHDPTTLFDLIERHSFGLLVSQRNGEPVASHLPFLVDRRRGPSGALLGHMARANPQWEHADGQTVLAVFSGPHAYVSPTWYESDRVVPTWNYAAVHVYGSFRAVHDERDTIAMLADMVRMYEASMPAPWAFDAESDFSRNMAHGVVAFRIEIQRLEGQFKLSQNQSSGRRENVIAALKATNDANATAVAAIMNNNLA